MLPRRSFLSLSLAAVATSWPKGVWSAQDSDPADVLRKAGLSRQRDGIWLLAAERRLRKQLADLSLLRDSISVLERDVAEAIRQNRETFEAIQPLVAGLKQAIDRLPTGDPKRRPLEQQLVAEQRKATPPEQLGGRSDVRALVVQLSQHRIEVTLRLLDVRRTIPYLLSDYARLSEDRNVVDALGELGRGNRLGPLRPLEPELRKLAELDLIVLTSHVPIWLQSGHVRLTAIIQEKRPLTLSWNEYPGHGLVLTSSAAQALDLQPPPKSETRTLEFTKGRKISAQRAVVPSLRLARWVARDVAAWILAPEGEDLGSQIDSTSLEAFQPYPEPAALRLTLQKRS